MRLGRRKGDEVRECGADRLISLSTYTSMGVGVEEELLLTLLEEEELLLTLIDPEAVEHAEAEGEDRED
ncbi:MAG: hypothetical protein DRK00_07165 [Thermoprotei archaeon]|nr:MAG: hypothetical protein DRK00_07165 [Thermoprotei archaeon]